MHPKKTNKPGETASPTPTYYSPAQLRAAITTRVARLGVTRADLIDRLEAKAHVHLKGSADKIIAKVTDHKVVLAVLGSLLSTPAEVAVARLPAPAAEPRPTTVRAPAPKLPAEADPAGEQALL